MIDPETKQLLRVIAAALTAIAECQAFGHEKDESIASCLKWLGREAHLLADIRDDEDGVPRG